MTSSDMRPYTTLIECNGSRSAKACHKASQKGVYGPVLDRRWCVDFNSGDASRLDSGRQLGNFGVIGVYNTRHLAKTIDDKWIYPAIVRYYTFVELDLRHVCCSIVETTSGPLPEEELQEIGEEDLSLLKLFESLLAEFEGGRRYDMNLEEFFDWLWEDWAPRIRDIREKLASQRLTDEQLRDAESVGVVWEAYGPQPMEESSERYDVRKHDLWDAMDRLDKIATDPERPTQKSSQSHT
ncbi:hypothetical protein FVER53590_29011 [Fusarium verticillioides]|nr:hypothetical protein FVER53590_29011 [Fusarium verticillioides]